MSPCKMVGREKRCIVGERVYKTYPFLKEVAYTRSEKRRQELLEHATPDELLAIVEICANILASTFRLTERQRRKLLPHADFIRRLSRSRSAKTARSIVQVGNGAIFSPLLIPVLLEIARFLIK